MKHEWYCIYNTIYTKVLYVLLASWFELKFKFMYMVIDDHNYVKWKKNAFKIKKSWHLKICIVF